MIVDRRRRRLEDENGLALGRLLEEDRGLAVREALDRGRADRHAELGGDLPGEGTARRAGQEDDVVHDRASGCAKRFHSDAQCESRDFTAWCTLPSGNVPSAAASPASRPVRIGQPSSIRSIAQTWKRPASTAARTSRRSTRLSTLRRGTITPWPSSPTRSHAAKKPSIFCVTPPTGRTCPFSLTAPVTAIPCRSGTSPMADMSAYSSATDALSPSTSSYICSKERLAERISGSARANIHPRYPERTRKPLLCSGPLSFASRSMLITPPVPMYALAVTRIGRPKSTPAAARRPIP